MDIVNKAVLESILSPIIGIGDSDDFWEKYEDIDISDEEDMKRIITFEIMPYFKGQNESYRDEVKKTFSYYLTSNTVDFDRILGSNLIPFTGTGEDSRLFFVWIWESLFGEESYSFSDASNCQEIDDGDLALMLERPDLEDYFILKRPDLKDYFTKKKWRENPNQPLLRFS